MSSNVPLESDQVTQALASIDAMLAADGYGIAATVRDRAVTLTITAGPEACADCLVPEPVLRGIAAARLAESGIDVVDGQLTLIYPSAGSDES